MDESERADYLNDLRWCEARDWPTKGTPNE